MLVSLHLPKTAGSSFLASLESHYGSYLLRDYGDLPIVTPIVSRNCNAIKACLINAVKTPNSVECIHGHFLPLKYLLFKEANFITWVRDPVERLASHYYYWVRNYDPKTATVLHRKVVEDKWTLERFCLGAEFKNIYSQFLWGFPIRRFDFIGITEYYEEELKFFSQQFLKSDLEQLNRNVNPSNSRKTYIEDEHLRRKIEKYHSKDMEFYKQAMTIRMETRCS